MDFDLPNFDDSEDALCITYNCHNVRDYPYVYCEDCMIMRQEELEMEKYPEPPEGSEVDR
jgi:hypothetical protein